MKILIQFSGNSALNLNELIIVSIENYGRMFIISIQKYNQLTNEKNNRFYLFNNINFLCSRFRQSQQDTPQRRNYWVHVQENCSHIRSGYTYVASETL